MAETMIAALVRQFGQPLTLEEVPVPTPNRDQILVEIKATGVCHTDLHARDGDWPAKPALPFIPGHEGVGIVAKAGSDVKNLKEGDRVGVPWLHSACGACPYCWTGWETLCAHQETTGYSVNGSFARFALADPHYTAKLPDSLNFGPAAPILCAGVTVYKGIKETEVKPGQWIAISGIGGLGHIAIQYAKAMGMHVAAIDIHPDKLALAGKMGADLVLNAKEDPAEQIQKQIGGVHGVLVTAVSPAAFEQAFDMLRPLGTMALVGLPPGRFGIPIFDTVMKRITVRGSIVGTREDLAEALQFAAEGKVKAHFEWDTLNNINTIFDRMAQGQIDGRIVLNMAP